MPLILCAFYYYILVNIYCEIHILQILILRNKRHDNNQGLHVLRGLGFLYLKCSLITISIDYQKELSSAGNIVFQFLKDLPCYSYFHVLSFYLLFSQVHKFLLLTKRSFPFEFNTSNDFNYIYFVFISKTICTNILLCVPLQKFS